MTTEIKEFSAIDAAISELQEKYSYLPDCSTDHGLDIAKADYKTIRKFEIDLDKKRKELTKDLRDQVKTINDSATDIDSRLKNISTPFKNAIDARIEELRIEELKRIDTHKSAIAEIQDFVQEGVGKSSMEISDLIEAVDMIEVDEHFEEFQTEARESLNITKSKLAEMLTSTLQKEALEQQLEQQRKENEEKDAELEELRKMKADMLVKQLAEAAVNAAKETTEKRESEISEVRLTAKQQLSSEINDWASLNNIPLDVIHNLVGILKSHNLI